MDLNFEALIRPYMEDGRTIKGQIRWLRKKGITPFVIERAVQDIYVGLQTGVTYPTGHDLDQALLQRAIVLMDEETEIILQRLERVNIPGGRWSKAWKALTGKL